MTGGLLVNYTICLQRTFVLFSAIVSVSYAALSDDMREEIVAVHNTLRRNFANGAEGAFVGNMKKLVGL